MTGGTPPRDQTLLGVVFAFDVESLGPEQAFVRAWQLWMERLDAAELCGAALYDGALALPGLPLITVIAVSGPRATVGYVHDAFAAPDLAAYPGIAPITHRFIDGPQLPRERLVLRGYVSDEGQFVPRHEGIALGEIARHAGWAFGSPPPAATPLPLPPRPAAPSVPAADLAVQATQALSASRTEGATQVMLRLWQSSFRAGPSTDRRRRIFALVGTLLILASLGFLALRFSAKLTEASNQKHPVATKPAHSRTTNGPLLVVAPLALRIYCTPGRVAQFTISNNGLKPLTWSSNGADFDPPLSISAVNGTIAPGASEVVMLTASEYVVSPQTAHLAVTSNGGTAHVTLTIGNCALPTATPTPSKHLSPTPTTLP
jgi:hypothetical protein